MEKTLPSYLQLSKPQIIKKFKNIKAKEDERLHDATVKLSESWSVSEGVKGSDLKRNRYANVLPYDLTRIKLKVKPGYSDYINASRIKLNLSNQWNEKCDEANYISTQGPTSSTTSHFWQLIMQSTVAKDVVICMVTPLKENRISKCFKYWCHREGDYVTFNGSPDGFANNLKIKCTKGMSGTDIKGVYYTELKLESHAPKSSEILDERVIHHLYYDEWTDFSRPDNWESIHQLSQRARELTDPENPIVTHCSAGAGRTGTFLTLDYLFNCVHDHQPPEQGSDLVELTVQTLRAQRMMMVQSLEQYLFVYDSLRKYLLSG